MNCISLKSNFMYREIKFEKNEKKNHHVFNFLFYLYLSWIRNKIKKTNKQTNKSKSKSNQID
jgi:hypothetical protein